jgi:hypothetical protein
LPKQKVGSFLEALASAVTTPALRIGGVFPELAEFRFEPLEPGTFCLIATSGVRVGSYMNVVAQISQGFRYTRIDSVSSLPLQMQALDLNGDGVDEVVTAEWPAGYLGATTPPIYWYTVWRFHAGVPEDASAGFPDFYRGFVLGQLRYPEYLLQRLEAQDARITRVPLAEIAYVRLKFQRTILGQANAGLEEALGWARSDDTNLRLMGAWSMGEMTAPAAGEELAKLSSLPAFADVAKAALARRKQLMESKAHAE